MLGILVKLNLNLVVVVSTVSFVFAFLEAWRPFNDLYGDFADSLALHLGSMPDLGQLLIHVMQTACHVALVALLISPRPIKGWGKENWIGWRHGSSQAGTSCPVITPHTWHTSTSEEYEQYLY